MEQLGRLSARELVEELLHRWEQGEKEKLRGREMEGRERERCGVMQGDVEPAVAPGQPSLLDSLFP